MKSALTSNAPFFVNSMHTNVNAAVHNFPSTSLSNINLLKLQGKNDGFILYFVGVEWKVGKTQDPSV